MFKGFQQTGQPRATYNSSNLFGGFPETVSSTNALSPVTTGIEAWWISQTNITASGSNVTSWVDSIGGTYSLQPTTTSPTYNGGNSLYLGYPSLGFTSTQNLSAGNVLNIGTASGLTVIAVVNLTSTSGAFLSKASSLADTTAGTWSLHFASNAVTFYYGQGTAVSTSSTFATPATSVVTGVVDRTNGLIYCYVNYITPGGAAITATSSNVTPTAVLGLNAIAANVGAFTIMEIMMYNQALTQIQVYQNVAYLRSKYGI